MDAIRILMDEHRAVERLLDGMEAWAHAVRDSPVDGRERVGAYARAVKTWVDPVHHGKEEDILFAAMVEAGFPRHGGPVAVMLHEHAMARELVARMQRAADSAGAWDAAQRADVVAAVTGYVDLMRPHIQKEDRILYPMADMRLPAEEKQRVEAAFHRFATSPAHAHHAQLAVELEALAAAR